MPSAKTEITEIVTGAAIAGAATVEHALAEPRVANVASEVWDRLRDAHARGQHRQEFAAAWANGQAFLAADQGLRGPTAVAGRVEGTDPGSRRRGGARPTSASTTCG